MRLINRLDDDSTALNCRHHFPTLSKTTEHGIRIFADNSSRSQIPEVTLNAVANQLLLWETHKGGQAAWDSPRAERTFNIREQARIVAAAFCGGDASQIGFAANGTGTLAVLARAMFGNILKSGDTIVITEADHDANRLPWQALAALGCHVIDVPVLSDGGLDESAWQAALAKKPKVVAFCMLSNVTGVLLPYARLAAEAKSVGSVVVLDAVQGPPHGYTNIMIPPVDVAIFSNCKLFSPHLGWWAIRPELVDRMGLKPDIGSHPMLEWGTYAHSSYAGFISTYDYLCNLGAKGDFSSSMSIIRAHEAMLSARFLENIPDSLRSSLLAADTPYRRVPIFSLALPRARWPSIKIGFEAAGIDVRIGQFGCPATLKRLAAHYDNAALRMSFVHYNNISDIDAVCEVLNQLQDKQ